MFFRHNINKMSFAVFHAQKKVISGNSTSSPTYNKQWLSDAGIQCDGRVENKVVGKKQSKE